MKKKALIIGSIAAVFLLLFGLVGYRYLSDYSHVLKANWGISLPFKSLYKEIYEKDSGASFHGDGIRYHVFSYRYEDYIDLMFVWGGEEGTVYYESYSEAAAAWLDEIAVPADKRPDFDHPNLSYRYKTKDDHDELLLIWDSEQNLIYVPKSLI